MVANSPNQGCDSVDKNSMSPMNRKALRDTLIFTLPAVVMVLIAIYIPFVMSGVYSLTKPSIENNAIQKKLATYQIVCPDAVKLGESEKANQLLADGTYSNVDEFFEGRDADGNLVGYVMSVTVTGFQDKISMAIGLNTDGSIQNISFISIKESPGVGMRAQEEPAFIEQFLGKQGTLVLTKDGASGDQEIDALSGATITSTAVTNGVNAGLAFCEAVTKGGN